MSDKKTTILDVRKVSKDFPLAGGKKLSAVADISFSISEGECFAVIGESGCGKSTLAKLITRVEDVSSGEIIFRGEDITKRNRSQLKSVRRYMQMIFQSPISVISPRMTIGSFLMEPYINYRLADKTKAKEEIVRMLEDVRLSPDCLKKYPHQLSGGELQRICIARSFSLKPELLICDEITSALDVSVQQSVMQLFNRMRTDNGTACLFICHDLALVNNYSDRVAVMYLGQAVEIMKSEELGIRAVHPYTRGLLRSMLFISSQREKGLELINGEPQSPIDVQPCCRFCTRCPNAEERCFRETPPLCEVDTGHYAACFNLNYGTILSNMAL